MIYLCFDYGTKRIGVAKSDELGLIATPVTTLTVSSPQNALKQIRTVIKETSPTAVVFGYPLRDDGTKSLKCLEIDEFVAQLEKYVQLPFLFADESFSSEDAISVIRVHGKRIRKDKGRVDRIAAVIILQRFLDEQRED